MSYLGETQSLAFGEPGGELFGTATVWDDGSCSSFPGPVQVQGNDLDDEWRLTGDGVELTFEPLSETAELDLPDARITSLFQLTRVHGTVALAGDEHEVDCTGQRTRRLGSLDAKRFGALRTVCAWFDGANGVAVLAARPRRARGHDSELLDGVLLEAGVPVRVTEPRLSSTYTADGIPARVGLELWFGEDDDAEQYGRRAAGTAIGREAACDDPPLRSDLLRWRMQGREGIGVYELLRTR